MKLKLDELIVDEARQEASLPAEPSCRATGWASISCYATTWQKPVVKATGCSEHGATIVLFTTVSSWKEMALVSII